MNYGPVIGAADDTYNAGYDTGWEAGERFARQRHDRILWVAITAIELRIQQLEQHDERVATVELEWALALLKKEETS